jgi:hypothetical protein
MPGIFRHLRTRKSLKKIIFSSLFLLFDDFEDSANHIKRLEHSGINNANGSIQISFQNSWLIFKEKA